VEITPWHEHGFCYHCTPLTRARDRRVELAQLDLAAATIADDGEWVIPAKLSRDGWQVLGDHYPQSTPLDPVRLKLAPR
jgi:hypothetical protein